MANGATWTYDSVRKHQVIEAGSIANEYAYDANGNMTSWMGNPITWTSYNYPSSITDAASGESVTFRYGPTRNPWLEAIQNASGTTETYRFGSLMDLVNSGSGIAYRNYIYAGTDPVAVDTINGSGENLEYFQTGAQGSIDAITNSSGQVLLNESFTAYGARRNPTTWSGAASSADLATSVGITQHGYTFQRALGEQMGLNDMVGRVEDAVIGRFMSADPTMPNPFDPQSFNPYSYTGNNPLTYTDPTGFRKKDNASSGKGGSSTGGGAGVDGGGGGNGGGGGALRPVVINGTQGVPSSGGGGGGVGAPTGISGHHLAPQGNPPSTTLQPIVITPSYALPDTGAVQQAGFAGLDFLGAQFLSYVQGEILRAIGCKSAACGVLATIVITAVAPEDAEGAAAADSAGGTTVYRVFGGEANGLGQYWTTVDPGSIPDYRGTAGLFPGNAGQFVIQGTLNDTSGVSFQLAAPGPGGFGGGLPEVFVPNPGSQISITGVSGVNPPF